MTVADPLEERFWALAQTQTAGFGFAPDCESLMRSFISLGVARLKKEGFADNEYKIYEAEANLSRFIHAMTQEAMRLGLRELHEPTFNNVWAWICPLWAFC